MYRIKTGGGVIRLADGACIPADPGNADWRDYQAWVAAGNTADPAPEERVETRAERVEAALTGDAVQSALVEEIAARLGVTARELIDGAKARAAARAAQSGGR